MKLNLRKLPAFRWGRLCIPAKLSVVMFSLNVFSIILGYLWLAGRNYLGVWSIYGFILLLTLCGNLLLVHYTGQRINTGSSEGKRLKFFGYNYLIFSVIANVGMLIGTTLLSTANSNEVRDNLMYYVILYFSYFGLFIFGGITAFLTKIALQNPEIWGYSNEVRVNFWRFFVQIGCFLALAVGLVLGWITLFGANLEILEVFVPEFGPTYAFVFLSIAVLYLQLINRKKNRGYYYTILLLGLAIFSSCLLPLAATSLTVKDAAKEFDAAFGADWRARFSLEAADYLQERFPADLYLIPAYFLGLANDEFLVKRDVLFYQGEAGVDEGIKLYFDAYFPPDSPAARTIKNPTIIRIHGGAWITGDKGVQNMIQMNKYFASQGYTVFDIQYGLTTASTFSMELAAPDYVKGEFSMDDIVRHIGIFTKYLVEHAEEYNVDLNSIFISGGSAGGHLTAAAGLGIANGKYADIFGSGMTIKGIIPFYPANGIADNGGITGLPEMLNPELLVDENSPPVLIFQGTNDSLVPKEVSQAFKDRYLHEGNQRAAIIWMPFGGHACDLNFAGYYNQVFLHYMKKFLYLYQ